jgi:tape measure domain-containing protein
MTETVQKAFAVGGATTAEAWGGAVQLSQGIASNRFSGDEFRSVAENAPVLLQGMAKHLGVTIGKLREMAHAGQLTADVVTRAIIGASDEIDAAFAKTTSTIEQAWTRVGNAVTKYAMDSKQADAASLIIVGTLNMLAENVGDVATALSLLGIAMVSALGGRAMSSIAGGIRAVTTETAKARAQSKLAAQESLKAAQAEAAANATRLASAKAYYNTVTQGVATEKTRHRASQALYKANLANAASQKALTAATEQYGAAASRATARAVALSAAQRTGGFLLGLVGGAPGAALLAILGSVAMIGSAMSNADAATADWIQGLRDAGLLAEDAKNKAGEIDEAIKTGNTTRLREELAKVNVELDRIQHGNLWDRLTGKLNNFDAIIKEVSGDILRLSDSIASLERAGLNVPEAMTTQLADFERFLEIIEAVREAGGFTQEFREELQQIANRHKDLDPLLATLDEIAPLLDAGSEAARRLENDLARLDGTVVNIRINYGEVRAAEDASMKALGDMQTRGEAYERQAMRLASMTKAEKELADEMSRVRKELERREAYLPESSIRDVALANIAQRESFKTPKKTPAPRKTADDRFDNMLQALQDRTQALIEERNALNLSYAEQLRRQEALKLEQEALKQAREEARRKGDQDWQNAGISEEQIRLIHEKVDAHVAEAMALKEAKESQEAWKDAAASAGDLLRGLIDGSKDWKDALLDLIPVVLKLMNSLNVAGGGKGLFGGGIFQSLMGGLLGVSFHGGGTVGKTGNVVQFPTGAPFAGVFHGGGNIGAPRAKHDEMMALVKKHETVLTSGQTDRTISALSASASRMKERDYVQEILVRGVFVDDGGVVHGIADSSSAKMGAQVARAVPSMALGAMDTGRTRRTRTISPGGGV